MKPAPVLSTKKVVRVPDELWLTKRCQQIVNAMNQGMITEEQAVADLQGVGNTPEQCAKIIELHRGRPIVKVSIKKRDSLRPARR